jgi:hypothetical protein
VAFLGGQAKGKIAGVESFMRRRVFVSAALAAAAWPAFAQAQTATAPTPAPATPPAAAPITPQNALETTFVAALTDEQMRPVFRRQLLEAPVALVLASSAPDAPPREFPVRDGVTTSAVFTSSTRLDTVLGPAASRTIVTGRDALTRLRGKNVVINPGLVPMLTLEAEDVELWLEPPLAGPTE